MKFKKLKFKKSFKIHPKIFKEKRGYFFESFHKKKYKKFLGNNLFVQDDHSFSKKNVLRGIHFQFKNPQSQLMYLAQGKLFVVLVDFRPKSKTFLKHQKFILDSRTHTQLYVPPGVGTGFYTLASVNHVIYKISELYKPNTEMGIKWNDPTLKIKWPCSKPLIGEKDKKNKLISNVNFQKFKDLKKLKV